MCEGEGVVKQRGVRPFGWVQRACRAVFVAPGFHTMLGAQKQSFDIWNRLQRNEMRADGSGCRIMARVSK